MFEPADYKNDCKHGSFVCVPLKSPFFFEYSYSGKPEKAKQCIGFINLPIRDGHSWKIWGDNFLCTEKPLDIVMHGSKPFNAN